MRPPFPSLTPTWHNDTYDAIAPTRPELSAKGKTVVVIGGGTGIGRETAIAFAAAEASKVVLAGRTKSSLDEAASAIPSTTATSVHVADITKEGDLQQVAQSVGQWDVLVITAGDVTAPISIAQASMDEWWRVFEVNVKGTALAAHTFVPTANPTHAAIIGVTAGAAALPISMLPGISSYMGSKLAQTKVMEYVAAENPHVFASAIHPGMIETAVFKKSGSNAEHLPMDTLKLPAHFIVWLASPEGAFLNGRSPWANWDVEELMLQAEDIQSGLKMTAGITGWPY